MSKRPLKKIGKKPPKELADPDLDTAVAIKRLRKDLSLTQLDLAREVEITPTSVYRYEAGTSVPNIETLSRLCDLAREKASPLVSLQFGRLLWARVGPRDKSEVRDAARGLSISQAQELLAPEQRLLAMAFIKMLRESSDATAERVFAVLLEPWIKRVRDDASSEAGASIHEEEVSPQQKFREKRHPRNK